MPKQQLHTCTNPRLTEPSSTFRSSSLAANSPHLHLLPDAVRTSTLVGPHPPVSVLLQLPDVAHPLRAMADPRETLIHTGQGLFPDLDPRDAIEPAQDPFLRALDRHPEDEEDGEIALVVMEAGEEGARVIATTAVTMIGAVVGAVGEAAVEDAEVVCLILIYQHWSLEP